MAAHSPTMSSQAPATEVNLTLLDKIDSLKVIHSEYVSQFEAKLSQLQDAALLESKFSAKAQETWANEKASLEARIGALQASFKAQEERANVAHQVYKACSKQRDDAVKAEVGLAHSLSVVTQEAKEAVNLSALLDQKAKVALKNNEDLKTQVKELQSALHGAELVADDNKDAVAKLQERLGKATKGKTVLEKEEMQAKLSASDDTLKATERRLAEVESSLQEVEVSSQKVEGSLQEQQHLLKESVQRELELQQEVETLRKASASMYDEQDLAQFLGEAEDAQAAAEQGWSEAQHDIGMLREYITAHNLEVPDCYTQLYDDDAEAAVFASHEELAITNMNSKPTNMQPTDQDAAGFGSASGTALLPELAMAEVEHMSEAATGDILDPAEGVTPEADGCGDAEGAAVSDPGAGFETVKPRRKPKRESFPYNKKQSGRRPPLAQPVAKPSGLGRVLAVARPAPHRSTKPPGSAAVLTVPRLASHRRADRRGDHLGRHSGGNPAAAAGRTRGIQRHIENGGGYSQSRSGRGGFRQGGGGSRGHVNTSHVLEVPRQ